MNYPLTPLTKKIFPISKLPGVLLDDLSTWPTA